MIIFILQFAVALLVPNTNVIVDFSTSRRMDLLDLLLCYAFHGIVGSSLFPTGASITSTTDVSAFTYCVTPHNCYDLTFGLVHYRRLKYKASIRGIPTRINSQPSYLGIVDAMFSTEVQFTLFNCQWCRWWDLNPHGVSTNGF